MATRGGKRPNAGRKAGTPNKATQKRQAEVAASGLTPLEFMLMALRDEGRDFLTRFEAAKAAAPYVHPKLASTELKGDPDAPVALSGLAVTFVNPNDNSPS